MDKIFLLLLSSPDAEMQQASWCITANKNTTKKTKIAPTTDISHGSGTIEDFARIYIEKFPDKEVSAVISGQYLTYTNVALAVKNQKQMLQALPFLVEEQVIGNIEDMHIALPEKLSGDSIRIAIIEKATLDKVKAIFSHYNIKVNEIFGLPDLLSCNESELQVLLNDDFAIVKGSKTCFQCDQVNLETVLELVPLDDISTINISLHELNKSSLSLAKRIKSKFGSDLIKIQSSLFTGEMLDHIIRNVKPDDFNPLDILQGDFSLANGRNKKLTQFLPLAWVAILCVFFQISFNIASALYFKRLSDRSYQSAVSSYLKLFPEEKNVVDLASQLNAKTNSLNLDSKANQFPVVFGLTAAAMNSVGKHADIKLKQFRYDSASGEFRIGLDTTSIALLDKFKNKLSENNLTVEIISANEENGIIKASVSIKNV